MPASNPNAQQPGATRIPNDLRDLFRRDLVAWYRANRRDLPWRRLQDDAYAVWVSEVMLQQTQVATVIPYYERWMARFPSLGSLAEADEQDVLRHWAGLGYYARARNLHRSARYIVERLGGRMPVDREALASVPGIGPYTVGAILSLALDQPAAIVDGNVARVFGRVFALDDDVRSTAGKKRLWEIAEQLVPAAGARDYNQALMELGATVCTPRTPRCDACPMHEGCRAAASGEPTAWPRSSPRTSTIRQIHAAAVIVRDGCVLLGQRASNGRWGGLWELPTVLCADGETTADGAVRAARELVGLDGTSGAIVATVRHTVTHHSIRLAAHDVAAGGGEPHAGSYRQVAWAPLADAGLLPLCSPQSKLIAAIAAKRSAG